MRAGRPWLGLIDPDGDTPLARALAERMSVTVVTRPSLAARSVQFDRVLTVLRSTPAHGPALALVRFGGAVLLADGHLTAAYDQRLGRGRALAEAEAGRGPDRAEWAHWRAGTLRPRARLLADALVAPTLLVHSPALQRHLAERHGRVAHLIPVPIEPARPPACTVAVHGGAQACAAGVWALEQCRAWGLDLTLALSVPQADLAERLGMTPWVEAIRGHAGIEVFLAMPGETSPGAVLAQALATGRPCIASRWLLDAIDAPDWLIALPDEPSPPLLAEAIAAALGRATVSNPAAHDPGATARAVVAALGL